MVSSQEMVSWHFGIPFSLLIHGTVLKKKKDQANTSIYERDSRSKNDLCVFFFN